MVSFCVMVNSPLPSHPWVDVALEEDTPPFKFTLLYLGLSPLTHYCRYWISGPTTSLIKDFSLWLSDFLHPKLPEVVLHGLPPTQMLIQPAPWLLSSRGTFLPMVLPFTPLQSPTPMCCSGLCHLLLLCLQKDRLKYPTLNLLFIFPLSSSTIPFMGSQSWTWLSD